MGRSNTLYSFAFYFISQINGDEPNHPNENGWRPLLLSLSSKWNMIMAKLSVTLNRVDPQIPTNGSGPPKLQFKVSVFYFNSSKLPFVLYLEGHNSHRQVFTF